MRGVLRQRQCREKLGQLESVIMDEQLRSALESIAVADLTRADWIAVGMALKENGEPCSAWDAWSRNDKRYKKGECDRLWKGFNGAGKPVKAGTIIQMARDRGWEPSYENHPLGWDDEISYDGSGSGFQEPEKWDPAGELITYLELLFEPDDIVSFVTSDVWQNSDGKWVPAKGRYDRTAAELTRSLRKHPDDLGATLGDWKEEAGAWIRFNPVDGQGVKNENVTKFRFALVESDTLPISEQDAMYRKLELPIAALVHSGGKSLHAIVRVDAKNMDEYRERVNILYDFLEKQGLEIDKQNRNPSRLSRMPGVTRNGCRQYLAAVNIGRKSWTDWMDFVEGEADELPEIISLDEFLAAPPKVPDELIMGVLRKGHKGILAGPSKAGKSFALMELAIAISEGGKWIDNFDCAKGSVLYINLEIDPASTINRFANIYKAKGIKPKHAKDIDIWNLRGFAVPLDQLAPKIIRRIRDKHIDIIILDPIYKVITGDENSASDMGRFCNQFDKICTSTGAAMIYCHHHSKGAQGNKKAMDRASGSGVFARDPDAQIDLIELELSDEVRNRVQDNGASAWRMEFSLREFPNPKPLNIWFEYPLHRIDSSGDLKEAHAQGSRQANLAKSGRRSSTPEGRKQEFDNAFDACSVGDEPVTIRTIASYLGLGERTVKERINEYSDYYVKWGSVFRNEKK